MTKKIAVGFTTVLLSCIPGAGQAPGGAAEPADRPSNGVVEMSLAPVFPPARAYKGGADSEKAPEYGPWEGVLEVTIKNTSGLKIRCIRRGFWWLSYDVQVLDSEGNPVPLTAYGEEQLGMNAPPAAYSGWVAPTDLESAQGFTDRINLAWLFQIQSGRPYTVRVRRSRDLPPVDAMGRPLTELRRSALIKAGPGGTER